ncbi:MAG: site-specific integrase [Veillonella sp.]|nr:site-specific integrase [Veillonella sp.]
MQRLLTDKIEAILMNSIDVKTLTIKTLVDEFVSIDKGLRKVTTQQNIEYHANTLLKWIDGDILVVNLKAIYIQRMLNKCLLEKSFNYVKRVYSVLKQALRYGKRMGYINDISYLEDVILKRPPRTTEEMTKAREKFLTKDELKTFLTALAKKNQRVALLFEFQALTGLRIGELRALRVKDYNAKNDYIDVNATLSDKGLRLPPKNEYSARRVQLNKRARHILSTFISLNHSRKQIMQNYMNPERYIFVTDGGVPYDSHYLNKILKSVPFNKTVTTHTFRHTHISLLAEKQTPLKTIMARVGHNEPKTTLSIYTHVTDAMKEQEKQILDSIDIMA